ncbi:MAG: YeiH family putative sulfate export transporter [Chlorobi bacterium]|nr:YeiH family putative sulfate export transporter [Chlorobiota bacterium]
MPFSKENRVSTLNGILFVALFSTSAMFIADYPFLKSLAISPLIVGILIGVFYANTLRSKLPEEWAPGIIFSTKTLLRTAIVFYGFRLTFQNIADVGLSGILVSVIMVTTTFIIGYFTGTKIFKFDKDTTILISAGSSICGAAAVLATEPVINAKPYKSVIAVSTVVIFGTLSMFLYPLAYKAGYIPFSASEMGLYIGGTIHEVAHVVGAGSAIGELTAKNAVIVKMLRVMLIAPFLIILSILIARTGEKIKDKKRVKITIPWFAVFFIFVAGFNSLNLLPAGVVNGINSLDTFLLTMAMTALGMETNVSKFKGVGLKPVYIASVLYVWLILGGYFVTKLIYQIS